MKTVSRWFTLSMIGVFGAGVFSGCATKQAVRAESTPPPGAVVLSPQEYEYVYVTGSNLPVLRPKNPSVQATTQIGTPVTTMSAEQFRELVRRGQSSGR